VDHIDRFGSSLKSILEAAIEIRDRQKNYRYSTIVAIAKEYINQHYSDVGLCLANVASHVKITPNYLSSILSQETGESFIEYLTRIRITKALELLNTTNMRVTDIAFAVGYQDSNYFSKIFHRITGETPSQARR
jgi:two-component system response regulator YesN